MASFRDSRTRASRSDRDAARDLRGAALLDELVRRHARELKLFLTRLSGNSHDAEELAQDVFVKAYRRLDTLQDVAASRRWLYAIAVNHFNDWIKPRRRRFVRAMGPLEGHDVAAPRAGRPRPEAEARELGERLLEAALSLPERQRTVLLMHSARDFDYDEIADTLGISRDAVKMSLFHAREKLRGVVERYGR